MKTAGMSHLNLPDGQQHDPISMQSPDQANQPSLIHNNVGKRGQLFVIRQRFDLNLCIPEPVQPGIIQLTMYLDLIPVLRIQTDR